MTDTLGPFALGRVHLADCLEAMRRLPAFGGVCITDPPWPCAIGEQLARGDTFDLFMRAMDLLRGKIRRLVVLISDMSDPRWLASVPDEWPFIRVCWARYTPPLLLRHGASRGRRGLRLRRSKPSTRSDRHAG